MMRRLAFAVLSLVVGVGLASADGVKTDAKKGAQATKREVKNDTHGAIHKAEGTVKSVTATGFVLTDQDGKELTFEVDKGTVVRSGAKTHKMSAAAADFGKMLMADERVVVRYSKPDDRMVAKDVKVVPAAKPKP